MLLRKMLAEFIGTALLVAGVIGSGIAASRLSPGDVGLQLFENAIATAGVLVAVTLAVGPVSGAHLNPVITLVDRAFGGVSWREVGGYIPAQIAGGAVGAMLANLMYNMQAVELSTKARDSGGVLLAEVIATFGLVLVVFGIIRSRRASVAPFAVAAYIAGAYFFTASTSFANPAVTIARMLSNTFAGIEPGSVPMFVIMQFVGALCGLAAIHVLYPNIGDNADEVVVPHADSHAEGKQHAG